MALRQGVLAALEVVAKAIDFGYALKQIKVAVYCDNLPVVRLVKGEYMSRQTRSLVYQNCYIALQDMYRRGELIYTILEAMRIQQIYSPNL